MLTSVCLNGLNQHVKRTLSKTDFLLELYLENMYRTWGKVILELALSWLDGFKEWNNISFKLFIGKVDL